MGSAESPMPLPSLHSGEGFSFLGSVPPGSAAPDDTGNSKSVVWVKPGSSGVVIRFQVDEFTFAWSAEHFFVHSHIYPCFMGKVSILTHFPLGPGCEDFSFLDQATADFAHSLNSVVIESINMPYWMYLLMTLMPFPLQSSHFLYWVSTVYDTSESQLAPGIKSCKLWCQARALLLPVSQAGRMSTSK